MSGPGPEWPVSILTKITYRCYREYSHKYHWIMRRFAFVLLVLAVGCGKKEPPPSQTTAQPAAAASQPAPAASSAAPGAPAPAGVPPPFDAEDLAGLAQGAVIAVA